jgi:hypothetical protein
VDDLLKKQNKDTGAWGEEPWICTDQNVVFPSRRAWSIKDHANPWYHNDELLRRHHARRRQADRRSKAQRQVDLPQEGQLDLGRHLHALDVLALDARLLADQRRDAHDRRRQVGEGAEARL